MRVYLMVCLGVAVLLGAGCGKERPTLAGGKPVSHWLTALHDPDPKERKQAVQKLGNVGATDPEVPPALIEALRDADAGVRAEAILALMKCGDAAQEAVPALTDMRKRDRNEKVRGYARQALTKLRSE